MLSSQTHDMYQYETMGIISQMLLGSAFKKSVSVQLTTLIEYRKQIM